MSEPTRQEGTYTARDGLALYYADHPAGDGASAPAILCLPGLTRNSRDFEELIAQLGPPYRVITTDLRGRGRSAYDEDLRNYHPAQYAEDVWCLLAHLGLDRVTVIGTSLGGLVAMLMVQQRPGAVAAVVLNDVGPRLNLAALTKLVTVAGSLPTVRDWPAARAALQRANGAAYPDWSTPRWQRFAEKMYSPHPDGTLRPALDPKVGRAAQLGLSGLRQDPWQVFEALEPLPTLLVRGAESRLLTDDGVRAMCVAKQDLQVVSVPQRGHAPNLDEPEAIDAIRKFLRTHSV